eukprot:915187-Amphidinium_carterae.2
MSFREQLGAWFEFASQHNEILHTLSRNNQHKSQKLSVHQSILEVVVHVVAVTAVFKGFWYLKIGSVCCFHQDAGAHHLVSTLALLPRKALLSALTTWRMKVTFASWQAKALCMLAWKRRKMSKTLQVTFQN